jgi:hypothetical protein
VGRRRVTERESTGRRGWQRQGLNERIDRGIKVVGGDDKTKKNMHNEGMGGVVGEEEIMGSKKEMKVQ